MRFALVLLCSATFLMFKSSLGCLLISLRSIVVCVVTQDCMNDSWNWGLIIPFAVPAIRMKQDHPVAMCVEINQGSS